MRDAVENYRTVRSQQKKPQEHTQPKLHRTCDFGWPCRNPIQGGSGNFRRRKQKALSADEEKASRSSLRLVLIFRRCGLIMLVIPSLLPRVQPTRSRTISPIGQGFKIFLPTGFRLRCGVEVYSICAWYIDHYTGGGKFDDWKVQEEVLRVYVWVERAVLEWSMTRRASGGSTPLLPPSSPVCTPRHCKAAK